MSAIKCHKRGPYKSRPASDGSGKLVPSVDRSMEFKQKRYSELTNGNLILEKWKGIYGWYACGVVPKAWKEALVKTTRSTLSEIELAKEGFLHL